MKRTGAYSVLQHLVCPASVKEATPGDTREPGVRLTWMKSCLPEALRSPVSWPGLARSGPPGHLQGARTHSSKLTPGRRSPPPPQSRPTQHHSPGTSRERSREGLSAGAQGQDSSGVFWQLNTLSLSLLHPMTLPMHPGSRQSPNSVQSNKHFPNRQANLGDQWAQAGSLSHVLRPCSSASCAPL